MAGLVRAEDAKLPAILKDLLPSTSSPVFPSSHRFTIRLYRSIRSLKHHTNIACLDLIRLISVNLYILLEIICRRTQLLSVHLQLSRNAFNHHLRCHSGHRSILHNRCEASDLSYSCICGNGLTPNLTEYSQTLPYFTCTEFGSQCVANCNGDSLCQSACRADHPCGAQNPVKVNLSTVTTASATKTNLPAGATSGPAGIVYNGLGGAATTPASDSSNSQSNTQQSGAEIALGLGHSYGLAVVFAGVFAGFALVL
ncbi:uncharacterized protein L3040_007628 [Drepanopeziza brunnea f. sp. 'multigermtubi']|uniref:uncharacterized protein n=1 Tax=Drepanopeziza brunnea f. sp. 'multigermtubi' TaxID=698441 RepID=UPI0023982841|nr:hypothetical protein L3040_007628 [Drepanopeziza brunnea f. sp. 'multigermtubi']